MAGCGRLLPHDCVSPLSTTRDAENGHLRVWSWARRSGSSPRRRSKAKLHSPKPIIVDDVKRLREQLN